MDILIRIIVGGAVVSTFALLGDMLRPKSFAGLFSAAPSVALATIALTSFEKGKSFAAIEARSMILGASATILYSIVVSYLLARRRLHVLPVTGASILVWFAGAFGLLYAAARMAE